MERKTSEFYKQLAIKRYELGSWTEVVNSGFCCEDDIKIYARGYSYFKWGIKPHIEDLGINHYRDMCSDLQVDAAFLMRDLYGVMIRNAYQYSVALDLDLPIEFRRFLFESSKSKYSSKSGVPDNDCAVRALAGMLDMDYDRSQKTIQDIVGLDPCISGIQIPDLKRVCDKTELELFEQKTLYGRKCISNITGYELYGMIPQLKSEKLSLGVYRHIYFVGDGIALDSRDDYLHDKLVFIVCKKDRKKNIIDLLANGITTPPDMKHVAYKRWANRTSWAKLAFDLQITKHALKTMTGTSEYIQEVKTLIFNWMDKYEFAIWFSDREKRLKQVASLMGVRWSDAFEIIMEIEEKHRSDNHSEGETDEASV